MKILILGAAGQISKVLTKRLVKNSENEIVLYARNANKRLSNHENNITIIDGDFNETEKLHNIIKDDVDVIYINEMRSYSNINSIIEASKNTQVKKMIGANVLGIYDEVPGEFGKWNKSMLGDYNPESSYLKTAELLENSGIDYTVLRITWLYNQEGNEDYVLTQKGEPFYGAQVTRQAVAKLIEDIIENKERFKNTNIGVGEPDTDFAKPSFY
ncbi:NAD(P)H-binding protein [[Acholeplasma] multilocale]|uniref:NAD(P)H-binding protein n=1 Tax=[Acholeplasma] multilocale TaxID=264638 RepID=UPI00047AC98E|nr:NAD(P)H-binding protein [[Acholeplasma] multilocale]